MIPEIITFVSRGITVQHWLTGFYNRDRECLLRGTRGIFKLIPDNLGFYFTVRPCMLNVNNVKPCPEVVWRVLATHSIRQFPLHFPSRATPCAITYQLESTIHTKSSTRYGLGDLKFVPRWGKKFYHSHSYKCVLGPPQTFVQCVPGISPIVKRPQRGTKHPSACSVEVMNVRRYTSISAPTPPLAYHEVNSTRSSSLTLPLISLRFNDNKLYITKIPWILS